MKLWKGFRCGINFRFCHICLEEKYFIMWSDIWQNVYWETSHTSSKCALIMGGTKKWHLWSVWTNVEHCPPNEGFILHINCTYQPFGAVWGLYNWSHPLHKWVNICSFSNSVWFGLEWERVLFFNDQRVLYHRGKKMGSRVENCNNLGVSL